MTLLFIVSGAWLLALLLFAGICTAAGVGDALDASRAAYAPPEPSGAREDRTPSARQPAARSASPARSPSAGSRGRTRAGNLAL